MADLGQAESIVDRLVHVEVPPGMLGITIVDHQVVRTSPPELYNGKTHVRVSVIEATSPLRDRVHVGWFLISIDGESVGGLSPTEVVDKLLLGAMLARLLTFLKPAIPLAPEIPPAAAPRRRLPSPRRLGSPGRLTARANSFGTSAARAATTVKGAIQRRLSKQPTSQGSSASVPSPVGPEALPEPTVSAGVVPAPHSTVPNLQLSDPSSARARVAQAQVAREMPSNDNSGPRPPERSPMESQLNFLLNAEAAARTPRGSEDSLFEFQRPSAETEDRARIVRAHPSKPVLTSTNPSMPFSIAYSTALTACHPFIRASTTTFWTVSKRATPTWHVH